MTLHDWSQLPAIDEAGERLRADWVFGYGSLIWDPGFAYEERHRVRIHGYHRAFCINSTRYRGTRDAPGVVLGLARGGSCHGVVYRLDAGRAESTVELLYRREMGNRSYVARLLPARLPDGRQVAALCFVASADAAAYVRLEPAELLRRLNHCHGARGANRDYAINTWRALQALGIVDRRLQAIVAQLEHDAAAETERRGAPCAGSR